MMSSSMMGISQHKQPNHKFTATSRLMLQPSETRVLVSQFTGNRPSRPSGSYSGTGTSRQHNGDSWFERPTRTGTANQPSMPKLSSFLSHTQTGNMPVANLDFSKKDTPLRVVPLGGLEEVGENMTFIEYGDDIIIIDAGLVFAGGEMYGVDYLIPDVAYLRQKQKENQSHPRHSLTLGSYWERSNTSYLSSTGLLYILHLWRSVWSRRILKKRRCSEISNINSSIQISMYSSLDVIQ